LADDSDNSIGFEIDVKERGLLAKVRSRFLSAKDRGAATRVDKAYLADTREVKLHQAQTDFQVALVEASQLSLVEQIKQDPELAKRVAVAFARGERQGQNIDACLDWAMQDLEMSPPSIESSTAGPDELDPDFVNRWEHYAGDASSDVAREKWARALSAEIRKPGTLSPRALRVIDEVDKEAAVMFGRFCANLIYTWVPVMISDHDRGELEVLEQAGLVVADELPRRISFAPGAIWNDKTWHALNVDDYVIFVDSDAPQNLFPTEILLSPIAMKESKLTVSVKILTQAGYEISNILRPDPLPVMQKLASKLHGLLGGGYVYLVHVNPENDEVKILEFPK
jgi:hypothetical protein